MFNIYMAIHRPKKIGKPIELFPRSFTKTAFQQKFKDAQNGAIEEYILFHSTTKPIIVFPITSRGEVVAVRQFRHAANQIITELPGGNTDPADSPTATVRQELKEETGFRAAAIYALSKKPIWFDPTSFVASFYPYLAKDCVRVGKPKPAAGERLEVFLMPLARWLAMIKKGEIVDAKTIVTTFLALPHLETLIPKPKA